MAAVPVEIPKTEPIKEASEFTRKAAKVGAEVGPILEELTSKMDKELGIEPMHVKAGLVSYLLADWSFLATETLPRAYMELPEEVRASLPPPVAGDDAIGQSKALARQFKGIADAIDSQPHIRAMAALAFIYSHLEDGYEGYERIRDLGGMLESLKADFSQAKNSNEESEGDNGGK